MTDSSRALTVGLRVACLGSCKLVRRLVPPAVTAVIVVVIGGVLGRLSSGTAAARVCHECARLY